MWSKMKSILRKRKIRIASELPEAVKAALEAVSTNDRRGWFRACGICIIYEDCYKKNLFFPSDESPKRKRKVPFCFYTKFMRKIPSDNR